MNKLVVAVKKNWEEQGVGEIVSNKRTISSDVNAIYLNSRKSEGQKDQFHEAFKSFGMIEQLDLALYILEKIENSTGSLPDHLRTELVQLLSNNKPIPEISEIERMAEAHMKYVQVLEVINDWNENMVGRSGGIDTALLSSHLIAQIDDVVKERTGKSLTEGFKTYLSYLCEDGIKLPSFADIEEVNVGLVGAI